MSKPQSPGLVSYAQMEYDCLACQSSIPRECVCVKMHPSKGIAPTRRNVKAYCEHCGVLYEAEAILNGGVWEIEGAVAIVADARARADFSARIGKIRGDIQRNLRLVG